MRTWTLLKGELNGIAIDFLKMDDLIVGWLGAEGDPQFIVDALNEKEQREADRAAAVQPRTVR